MKKPIKKQFILVSLNVLILAINEKLKTPLKVYLALKCLYEGEIKIDDRVKNEIKSFLQLKSIKTIQRNLKILEKQNWIRKNPKTGKTYIIVSTNKVSHYDKFRNRKHPFDRYKINKLDAYIGGYLFKYVHRSTCYRNNYFGNKILIEPKYPLGIKKEHGKRKGFLKKIDPLLFKPMSIKGISKLYDINYDQVRILKKAAKQEGLIEIRTNHIPMIDRPITVDSRAKRTLADNYTYFVKDRVYKRLPDTIRPTKWN